MNPTNRNHRDWVHPNLISYKRGEDGRVWRVRQLVTFPDRVKICRARPAFLAGIHGRANGTRSRRHSRTACPRTPSASDSDGEPEPEPEPKSAAPALCVHGVRS